MLHVVDPATEDPQNKLRKVESFIEDFKKLRKELYVAQNMWQLTTARLSLVSGLGFASSSRTRQPNGYKTLGAGG